MGGFGDLPPQTQNIVYATSLVGVFILGFGLAFGLTSSKIPYVAQRFSSNIESTVNSASFLPAILMLLITAAFAGGVGYVINKQILSDNTSTKNGGIVNSIGLSWGLVVIALFLIPISLQTALITPDSKFYLVASMLTFYFSTVVAEIVFINKLNNLPDVVDVVSTHNLQTAMSVILVLYGIFAFLAI